jgi:2-oxoglutarate dehydrogenase E1 component
MKIETLDIQSIGYLEEVWRRYQQDPYSVSAEWRKYFDELGQSGQQAEVAQPAAPVLGRQQLRQGFGPGGKLCAGCGRAEAMSFLQYNVSLLVRNYRVRGHLLAKVNPLGSPTPSLPELQPEYYGMSEEDLDLLFNFGHISGQ